MKEKIQNFKAIKYKKMKGRIYKISGIVVLILMSESIKTL